MNTSLDPVGGSRVARLWREWRAFVLFLAIMLVFRSAIADWNQVPTGSMIPSILEGDRIVVDKMAYDLRVPFTFYRIARFGDPERSDVITFESPVDGKLLVKRVIGIPDDKVELRHNHLYINDQPAHYAPVAQAALPGAIGDILPYTEVSEESLLGSSRTVMLHRRRASQSADSFGPILVPANHYLVLGDNRDNSQDYRFIGFVSRDLILGKANSIAFSLDYENYYAPRTDRFFRDLR
ncbi:MAG: signal peptidase I [Pseudomonadales bacterium]